jgi:NADH-quinone oxidoreductase subunit A
MTPTSLPIAASAETTAAIVVVLGLALIIPLAVLGINAVLSPHNPNANKLSTYESGLPATAGTARGRFAIKFYLIAILFVLFDVEAVFMYPWAVNFRTLGTQGFTEMLLFLGILFAGYIYVVKRGALDWD